MFLLSSAPLTQCCGSHVIARPCEETICLFLVSQIFGNIPTKVDLIWNDSHC